MLIPRSSGAYDDFLAGVSRYGPDGVAAGGHERDGDSRLVTGKMGSGSMGTHRMKEAELVFVSSQRIARLATIAADGTPSLVPICFALIGRDEPVIVSVLSDRQRPR
jgi:hypothetical protein